MLQYFSNGLRITSLLIAHQGVKAGHEPIGTFFLGRKFFLDGLALFFLGRKFFLVPRVFIDVFKLGDLGYVIDCDPNRSALVPIIRVTIVRAFSYQERVLAKPLDRGVF